MDWPLTIREFHALDPNIPDSRIDLYANLAMDKARAFLGADPFSALYDASDSRLIYAISAFTIASLITSSRNISEGFSVHASEAFGHGNIAPSEISEILRLAQAWESAANTTLSQLRNEIPADLCWVDI